jgi:Tfp pilus assembly protein FimT
MRWSLPRKTAAAFTLIEIIVVLFMMVMAASVVAPRMAVLLESMRMRDAARSAAALVRQARELAILREEPIAVRYDERQGLTLGQVDTAEAQAINDAVQNEQATDDRPPIPTRPVALPAGVRCTIQVSLNDEEQALGVQNDALVFSPDGRCPDAALILADPRGTGGWAIRTEHHGASVVIEATDAQS